MAIHVQRVSHINIYAQVTYDYILYNTYTFPSKTHKISKTKTTKQRNKLLRCITRII